MDWFKVQATLWMNPKVRAISPQALRVLLFSWCMAAGNETRGYVAGSWLPLLEAKPKLVDELVAAGLWDANGTGYVIHDWDEHQAEALAIQDRKARDRERKRRERGEGDGA